MSIALKKPFVAVVAALFAALLTPAAHAAAEAVTNGGFDNGTLDGWSSSGTHAGANCASAVNSTCSAELFTARLWQTLATVAGTSYSYSFWIDNGEGIDFSFKAGDIVLYSLHNPADSIGYTHVTGSFVAAGASTTIDFAVIGTSWLALDEVSVVGAVPTAAALPEPASLLLAGTALAGLAFTPRRRRA